MTNLEFYKETIKKEYLIVEATYPGCSSDSQIGYTLARICRNHSTYNETFDNLIDWLCEEHQILDDVEREYLSAVIRPFREKIMYIVKRNYYNCEYLVMRIDSELMSEKRGSYGHTELPLFKKDTMYKGMEVNKKYTLEELGL